MPVEATCHCGSVTLLLDQPPIEVTACNCSICRRYGVLWAYYPLQCVVVRGGPFDAYLWDDRSISFNRCAQCGCVTHWAPRSAGADRMGVNARLLDPEILASARVRHLDGAVSETYLD